MPNESLPLLSESVKIQTSGLRSIHLERDLLNDKVLTHYLLTPQSRATLARIIDGASSASPTRAWTLTGPYGTGKSLFAVFLTNLLSTSLSTHKESFSLLTACDKILSDKVSEFSTSGTPFGFFPIPITAGREPLVRCLARGFSQQLLQITHLPGISGLLKEIADWEATGDVRSIVAWLEDLSKKLAAGQTGYSGVLLIIDEMGKILEHASSHYEDVDLYLLQEIAEYSHRSGTTPFIFLGIFHQAFDEYARNLDQASRREWDKVQGRFQDIPFQEPPGQQIRLIAEMINFKLDETKNLEIGAQITTAKQMTEEGWLPPLMSSQAFITYSRMAFPLHPTSLVALPFLFRKLAQSERSIFAYLSLDEPFGFQDFLRHHTASESVRLSNLFDYFMANFQYRLYASSLGRALTETYERIQREKDLLPIHVQILKTTGMLLWLEEYSHIKADKASIAVSLVSELMTKRDIDEGLDYLTKKSILTFRKFNQSYAIFQGSDIDIDERVQMAKRKLGSQLSLGEEIQRLIVNKPFIARRHSIESGTTRYFSYRYIDHSAINEVSLKLTEPESGILLLCLPQNMAEEAEFEEWATSHLVASQPQIIVGVAHQLGRLASLVQELRCMQWVQDNTPALSQDITASKELRARISLLRTLIDSQLEHSLNIHSPVKPLGATWFYKGIRLSFSSRNGLSQKVSEICDEVYYASPIIRNEIINRRYLSTQGAAARRNLIERVLTKGIEPQLGIEGYPPERSIYESLFRKGQLHICDGGTWHICQPGEDDPLRLMPAWKMISDFVFQQPIQPRPLTALYQHLKDPPFGMTDGAIPLLLCAFYQVHKHEMTFYREGSLLTNPDVPDWEVLLRRPELFAIAGCQVQGSLVTVVERFAKAYQTEPAVMPVVRVLVSQLNSLPAYTLHTQHLPAEALAVRQVILSAHSPEQLLFIDIPRALGLEPFTTNDVAQDTDEFFNRLNKALIAMSSAVNDLRNRARDVFLAACHLQLGNAGWGTFYDFIRENAHRCTLARLEPFFRRIAEADSPQAALDSVLALIANRPLKSWTDMDEQRFGEQARAYGELMAEELEVLAPWLMMTPAQVTRSEAMVDEVERLTATLAADDPQALATALARLAQRLRKV